MFMCIICTLVRRMYYAILDPYRLGCSHFRVPTDFDDVASSLQRRFVAMIMQSVWWAWFCFFSAFARKFCSAENCMRQFLYQ